MIGAYPPQFVRRDRTQAGRSRGVLMVQPDLTGGSLHASRAAVECGSLHASRAAVECGSLHASRAAVEYGRPLAAAHPTPHDVGANESKVQANLVLLRCREAALGGLMALNTREDYPVFVEALRSAGRPLSDRLL